MIEFKNTFLMHFFNFFSKLSSIKTLQKHSMVHFGLYNPKFFVEFGLYNSNTLSYFFGQWRFTKGFGQLMECLTYFWTVGR